MCLAAIFGNVWLGVAELGNGKADPVTNLGNGSYLTCDWSIFRVYNRALSASEILQNYNTDSVRYS